MPNVIQHDAAREASASIRGYVYQIYQSIDAWMDLGPKDEIRLEASEDFDVYASGEVVTTQVKNLSKNLTLRSPEVQQSIENYLISRNSNPGVSIRFRLLSTAGRGMEVGDVLPMPGLECWDAARRDPVLAQTLFEFLRTIEKVGPKTQEFLATKSCDEFREQLLSNIEWDTGNRSIEGLRASLSNRLVSMGSLLGVSATESERVLPAALDHVSTLLSSQQVRRLVRAELDRLFERTTMETMPRGEAARLRAAVSAESPMVLDILRDPLPLVAGAVPRPALVETISSRLSKEFVVFIFGSTGLGKTALARMASNALPGLTRWATLRGQDGSAIARSIGTIANAMERGSAGINVVLDDLDVGALSIYRDSLVRLFWTLRRRGDVLLVTAYQEAPESLRDAMWASPQCNLQVPYFGDKEVGAVLSASGAPASALTPQLIKLVQLTTSGHPQLVQAQARVLARDNFDLSSVSMMSWLASGPASQRENTRRIVKEMASQDARILLYRLSLSSGPIRRRHASIVGASPPPVRLVGECLSELVGPWLEDLGDDIIRVSPLIAGWLGTEVLSSQEKEAVHAAFAKIPFVDGESTVDEFANAMMHALASRSPSHVMPFVHQLITRKLTPAFAQPFFPFLMVALTPGSQFFADQPAVDTLLRIVQFRLSNELRENEQSSFFANEAIVAARRCSPEVASVMMGMVAVLVVSQLRTSLPAQTFIELLIEVVRLEGTDSQFASFSAKLTGTEKLAVESVSQALMAFEAVRIASVSSLLELVGVLGAQPAELRDKLTAGLDAGSWSLLVNNAWLNDERAGKLDIEKALAAYAQIALIGAQWGCRSLQRAAMIAGVVLLDEYRHDSSAAFDAICFAEKKLGSDGWLRTSKAKVLFSRKDYAAACIEFEGAESDLSVESVDRAFSRRSWAIAQAQLGNWSRAEEIFNLAEVGARHVQGLKNMAVGLRADAAYAIWRSERYIESIIMLSDVLKSLASIDFNTLKSRHLHATVRHLIAYLWRPDVSGVLVQPFPGMCSNQEPHPKILELRIVDLDGAWELLIDLARRHGCAEVIQEAAQPYLTQQSMRMFQVNDRLSAFPKLARGEGEAIRNGAHLLIGTYEVNQYHLSHPAQDDYTNRLPLPPLVESYWTPEKKQDLCTKLVALGLVSFAHRLRFQTEAWREQLSAAKALFPEVDKTLKAMTSDSSQLISSDLVERSARMLGLLRHRELAPRDLYVCHFTFLNLLQHRDARVLAGDSLLMIVERWRSLAREQRAALIAPNLNCPPIIEACETSTREGVAKAASILLAAAPAVGMYLDANTQQVLREMMAMIPERMN
jgi:hypothetical protein